MNNRRLNDNYSDDGSTITGWQIFKGFLCVLFVVLTIIGLMIKSMPKRSDNSAREELKRLIEKRIKESHAAAVADDDAAANVWQLKNEGGGGEEETATDGRGAEILKVFQTYKTIRKREIQMDKHAIFYDEYENTADDNSYINNNTTNSNNNNNKNHIK